MLSNSHEGYVRCPACVWIWVCPWVYCTYGCGWQREEGDDEAWMGGEYHFPHLIQSTVNAQQHTTVSSSP